MLWKPIPGYYPYEASDLGQIRRTIYERNRQPKNLKHILNRGYYKVGLSLDHGCISKPVHQLVCLAFHGLKPFEDAKALHHDDDVCNNRPENLYWGTAQQNSNDRARNEHNPNTKLDWQKVREIRTRVAAGEVAEHIRVQYGISSATISNIVTNKAWKEV